MLSARTNLLTGHVSSRPLALKCLNWQSLHEFSLKTDINVCGSGLTCARSLSAPGWWRIKCSYSSIHSHWTRLNGLSTLKKKKCIAVVVMYWEARMRIHQPKHTLVDFFFFYLLFITNHIADALSDLSWTALLVCAKPCEPYVYIFFSVTRSTPSERWSLSNSGNYTTTGVKQPVPSSIWYGCCVNRLVSQWFKLTVTPSLNLCVRSHGCLWRDRVSWVLQ